MKNLFLLLISLSTCFFLSAQDQHPSKAYLGVNSNHVNKEKAKVLGFDNPYGAYVTEVIENTTAAENGIQPFDYLTGMNDEAFSADRRFSHTIRNYNAGDQATIQLIRNGQQMSLPITLGKQRDAIYRKMPKEEEPFFGVKQDHYNWRENVPGVKVKIVNNSTAQQMDLQDDDIITNINDYKIVDWHDLGNAVDNMTPGDPIKVNFLRAGQAMAATGEIQSYGQTYDKKNHHNKAKSPAKEKVIASKEVAQTVEEVLAVPVNSTVKVDMEDVTQEEADDMKEKLGVDMPIINNLEIEKLNIFPNPNDGVFNLMFELPNRGQTTIRIFNGSGRLIYQNDMQQFSGTFKERLDISNSARGIYFLEVNQDGKSITQKVILQ